MRNISPAFFTNEALYEAELAAGLPLRVAYAGLWCFADREGRFEWKPRLIKLDVLPFDAVDFLVVLQALEAGGWVIRYEVDGKPFGWIPAFTRHQNVHPKEAKSRLPAPPADAAERRGKDRSVQKEGQEGNSSGKQLEGNGKAAGKAAEPKGADNDSPKNVEKPRKSRNSKAVDDSSRNSTGEQLEPNGSAAENPLRPTVIPLGISGPSGPSEYQDPQAFGKGSHMRTPEQPVVSRAGDQADEPAPPPAPSDFDLDASDDETPFTSSDPDLTAEQRAELRQSEARARIRERADRQVGK